MSAISDGSPSWRQITQCRVCSGTLALPFCDLGEQPLANSYLEPAQASEPELRIRLRAMVCDTCRLVQLDHLAHAGSIFSDYAYLSSMSESWVQHAADFCSTILRKRVPDFVVELASNDGYLLQHFQSVGIRCLGIEPAANVAALARDKGIETLVRFFGVQTAGEVVSDFGKADLLIANNVLAHVPDINDFVAGMKRLLAPGGLISIETPHLVSLVQDVQFDTIYHEHYAYWSLHAVEQLFARHGLAVVDVERLRTHGGSLRISATHADEVQGPSDMLRIIRAQELALGVHSDIFYRGFEPLVSQIIVGFETFLAQCEARGESVAAYGAAAKGNTFLNRLGARAGAITCVADVNRLKIGRLLPGTHIPIVSPEALAARKPDYIVVLPWNLADEIRAVLSRLGLRGSRMVTAIPQLVISEIPICKAKHLRLKD